MSNTKNTGGPAFPTAMEEHHEGVLHFDMPGMTLRDYFAAKAMQGIVAGVSSLSKYDEDRVRKDWENSYPGMTWGQAAAEQSYHIADAMLKAREQ